MASYTWTEFSEEEKTERAKLYTGPASLMTNLVRSEPGGLAVPPKFKTMLERIRKMEVRPDDVFMVSFPKAGSTWTQELVWQIAHGFDVEKGKASVFFRAPFMEISMLCADEAGAVPSMDTENPADKMAAIMGDSIGYVEQCPSPRVIKTHLPLEFLPENILEKCKVIWVCRNVKDSCVSFYHHEQLLPVHGLAPNTFAEFQKMYMEGKTLYGPYWKHLQSGWEKKDHPNLHMIWFEEMKKDIRSVIRGVAAFLKQDFPDEKVEKLADHLSFDNFKNNDAVNMKPPKGKVPDAVRDNFSFIRKGKVGDWKNFFEGETLKKWDEWIENNNTMGVKFTFDQE